MRHSPCTQEAPTRCRVLATPVVEARKRGPTTRSRPHGKGRWSAIAAAARTAQHTAARPLPLQREAWLRRQCLRERLEGEGGFRERLEVIATSYYTTLVAAAITPCRSSRVSATRTPSRPPPRPPTRHARYDDAGRAGRWQERGGPAEAFWVCAASHALHRIVRARDAPSVRLASITASMSLARSSVLRLLSAAPCGCGVGQRWMRGPTHRGR
jgi:hypothetical protein